MQKGFWLVWCLLVLWMCRGLAQQGDSLIIFPAEELVDTPQLFDIQPISKKRDSWLNRDYPNPRKATLLSFMLPGAGQVYNKGIWYVKVPIIYAALGGVVYAIDFNQTNYRRFRTAYGLKLQDQTHEFSGTNLDNVRVLRVLRDSYDKNTQLSYIGFVAVYALQAAEAFVHAHLKTFDVSDDLSLQIKPSLQSDFLTGSPTLGIGIVLKFE